MNMEDDFETTSFAVARARVEEVLAALRALPGQPWIGYFERIEACLSKSDVECAVRARDDMPFAGMGGFGEFLEATPEIQHAYSDLHRIIGVLKLSSRYGIRRGG